MGRGRAQSGSRGRGPKSEFRSARSFVVFRSPPWLRAIGCHLGLDREESGFGASCILRWAFSDAVVKEYTVLFNCLMVLKRYSGSCHFCEMILILPIGL